MRNEGKPLLCVVVGAGVGAEDKDVGEDEGVGVSVEANSVRTTPPFRVGNPNLGSQLGRSMVADVAVFVDGVEGAVQAGGDKDGVKFWPHGKDSTPTGVAQLQPRPRQRAHPLIDTQWNLPSQCKVRVKGSKTTPTPTINPLGRQGEVDTRL